MSRTENDLTDSTRRRFLKASGAGAAMVSLTGCIGGDDEPGDEDDSDTGADDSDTGDDDTSSDPDDVAGGTLRYGLPEPPDSLNVYMASSVYSTVALNLVYDYGIATDPDTYEIMPWVFTDWELQDPDADQPEIVADVTDELVFNDGEPLTVEDVVFSYEFLNEIETGQFTAWNDYEWAEEDDGDWDVRIKMTEPLGTWDSTILGGVPIVPKHVWEDVDDWEAYDPWDGETGPVGTGPGVVTQWQPDTSMEVEFTDESVARDGYEYPLTRQDWYSGHEMLTGDGPYLDNVQWFVYGEAEAMNQALLQGEVDVVYEAQTETVNQLEDDPEWNIIQGPDSGLSYADWNHRRPPLNDIALRQAMAFCWDEFYWVDELNEGFVHSGNIPYTPGYTGVRPETQFGGELLTDPAVRAFDFRAEEEGSPEPDVEGIQSFLEDGEVIDGSEGTYVGKDYPGSLSGIEASYDEAQYDYSFGEAEADVLLNDDIEHELYVDGEPFSEYFDGEIEVLLRPPGDNPDIGEAWHRWAENCRKVGIPMRIEPTAFNAIVNNVPYEADFDMYELGWGGMSAFGTSLDAFFHSDNSNEALGVEAYSYNNNGYGNEEYNSGSADEIIDDANAEMEAGPRNELWATAAERAYLDVAYMTYNYDIVYWPHPERFRGSIDGIVDPPFASWTTQVLNMYVDE